MTQQEDLLSENDQSDSIVETGAEAAGRIFRKRNAYHLARKGKARSSAPGRMPAASFFAGAMP